MAPAFSFNMHNSRWLSIVMVISGSGKTYADFGLPILGGFNNMIRNFLGAGFFFYVFNDKK